MPGRRCGGHARCNPVTRYCDQKRAGTLATPSQLIPSNTPHKRHSLHTCKEPPRRPRTSSSAHPRRQRYQRPRGASTTTAPQAMATATPPAPALREHLAGGRSVIPASTTDVLPSPGREPITLHDSGSGSQYAARHGARALIRLCLGAQCYMPIVAGLCVQLYAMAMVLTAGNTGVDRLGTADVPRCGPFLHTELALRHSWSQVLA